MCFERLLQAFARWQPGILFDIAQPILEYRWIDNIHNCPCKHSSKLQLSIQFTPSRCLDVRQDWYKCYVVSMVLHQCHTTALKWLWDNLLWNSEVWILLKKKKNDKVDDDCKLMTASWWLQDDDCSICTCVRVYVLDENCKNLLIVGANVYFFFFF